MDKLSAGARRLSEVGALAGKPVATLVPQARTMELIRTEAILPPCCEACHSRFRRKLKFVEVMNQPAAHIAVRKLLEE